MKRFILCSALALLLGSPAFGATEVVSNKPFPTSNVAVGNIWVLVANLDADVTAQELIADGVVIEIYDVRASLVSGSDSPVTDYTLLNADGDHFFRGSAGAGGSSAGFGSIPSFQVNGIDITTVEAGTDPVVVLTIYYRAVSGTAPTEV